jgi:hypothetical protein
VSDLSLSLHVRLSKRWSERFRQSESLKATAMVREWDASQTETSRAKTSGRPSRLRRLDRLDGFREFVPSPCSLDHLALGLRVPTSLPQRIHTIRGPNAGAGVSSGQRSTFSTTSWRQAEHITSSDRTPSARMLPSVIGSAGSELRTPFAEIIQGVWRPAIPRRFTRRRDAS